MQIIHGYRDDASLRHSFDALAKETFGISFENWYQDGFWTDAYDPHSIVENGQILANVSVNQIDIPVNGKVKHFLQLGTVMTRKDRRNQGLARKLMEYVLATYRDTCDGFFLFANSSVLDFYPKLGTRKNLSISKAVESLTCCTSVRMINSYLS